MRGQDERDAGGKGLKGGRESDRRGGQRGDARAARAGRARTSDFRGGRGSLPGKGKSRAPKGDPTPAAAGESRSTWASRASRGRAARTGLDTNMLGRGAQMPSRLQYMGVIGQYRKMMEEAIAREQVPRDFQTQVKDYFQALGREIARVARSAPDRGSELLLARLPRAARAPRAALAARRSAAASRASARARARASSVEFSDYRAYGVGDDLRYVDWNIYGRLDRLYLKLFVDEEDLCLHLLLDASASMGFGDADQARVRGRARRARSASSGS